nr:RNA-directed DNA polymerase, eukaryota [Tanacetum cinerariifolium]
MLRRLEQNPTEVELNKNSIGHASKIANSISIGPGRFKKSGAPCNGGSILSLMEEVVRVGQTMGYKMEWCVNNITEIIESQGAAEGSVAETESNILIVVVYAPHDYRDKRILWDYLSHVSNQWNGDVVMMGDFNEVRHKSDRFRSVLMPMVNGFDKLVMNSWYDAPSHGNNAILSFMSKLKFLKTRIKEWNVDYRRSSNVVADKLKEELLEIDAEIDNGNGNAAIVARGPISLIGNFYKIIAKVLTNRLVEMLVDIVNEVQSAFIANRQILDGPFIVNEAIQWCKKKKKHALIFKFDFEKAYDSGGWDYLDDVLDKFGFGIKWHGWIQNCLRSSRGSILINGSPTKEFQFFKGLKQGDPLSSFLFILIMESLHILFQRVVDAGLYMGIRLSSDVNLSHLLYADDAMFVGKWSDSNIGTLVHVLKCFHQASGLKINMSKSKIMGIHVNNENVNDVAATLGCLTLKTPFVYLGVPSLYALNRGLLLKWVGRFHSQSASLWTRVIKAIHGVDGGLGRRPTTGKWDSTCFWEDKWFEGSALKDMLPRLFALENVKSVTVYKKLNDSSLDYSMRRKPRGGVEEDQYIALSDMMDSIVLMPKEDRFMWSLENSGDFSMKSIQKRIDDSRFIGGKIGTRWIKSVPIKVNIMAWKIQSDAFPTRFNISRRGMVIESIMCPICNEGVENTSHLFLAVVWFRRLFGRFVLGGMSTP